LRKLDPNLKDGEWTEAEDALLLTLRRDEELDFGDIAPRLPGRRVESIRDRYQAILDPMLNKKPWKLTEKKALFKLVESVGPKWKAIAPQFPGRSEASCRNTWFNNVQSKQRFKRRQDNQKKQEALLELHHQKKKKQRFIDKEEQHIMDLELIESVDRNTNNGGAVPAFETEGVVNVNVGATSASNSTKNASIPLKKRNAAARVVVNGASTPEQTEGDTSNVVEL
jgi:hypothetical protein